VLGISRLSAAAYGRFSHPSLTFLIDLLSCAFILCLLENFMKFKYFFQFLTLFGLCSACSPLKKTVTAADGMGYYAINCADFFTCMGVVREQCGSEYNVLSSPAVALLPGKAPAQIYHYGSTSMERGPGSMIFNCEGGKDKLSATKIRHEIDELRAEVESREGDQQALRILPFD